MHNAGSQNVYARKETCGDVAGCLQLLSRPFLPLPTAKGPDLL